MTEDLSRPPMPRTPREALGRIQRETVIVEGRTFVIDRPAETDALLDHPAMRQALADDHMPYWADVWPAARMLAKWVMRQEWPAGVRALEVGCGLGVSGLAALAKGAHVTFTDYDGTAVEFAAANARLNGFTQFEAVQLDWRHPPEGVTWPVLLASDLIYEARNVEPLVGLIKRLLAAGGVCLLTDQDRVPSHVLRQTLEGEGMPYTTAMLRAGEPGGRRLKGTLYRITHAVGSDLLPLSSARPG